MNTISLRWAALGAVLLMGHVASARAQITPERYEPNRAGPSVSHWAAASDRAQAERLIRAAACDLDLAARQSDFVSNERVLALLQSAQDKLAMATGPLWRERYSRVNRLLADIDNEIARGSAPSGPLASPDRESVGPLAPVRGELVLLAEEGQALEAGRQ
jgi:hypothetical protein